MLIETRKYNCLFVRLNKMSSKLNLLILLMFIYLKSYETFQLNYRYNTPYGNAFTKLYDQLKPAQVEVEFLPSKNTAITNVGKNLIDLGKSVGVAIPFSCRKGTCNKCKITVDGASVLACQSYSTWRAVSSSSKWNLVSKGSTCVGYEKTPNDAASKIQRIQVFVPLPDVNDKLSTKK